MAIIEIAPNNSLNVQVTLTNPITNTTVDDATVTGRIDDLSGNVIEATFTMAFVLAGLYRTTIDPVAGLTVGTTYNIIIDSTGSDSIIGHFEANVEAAYTIQTANLI